MEPSYAGKQEVIFEGSWFKHQTCPRSIGTVFCVYFKVTRTSPVSFTAWRQQKFQKSNSALLPSLGGLVVSTPVWHSVDLGSIPKVGCLDHGFRGFHGHPRRMLGQFLQAGHDRISFPTPPSSPYPMKGTSEFRAELVAR